MYPSSLLPADVTRVNTHDYWELRYWCRKWNCTTTQLKDVIQAVGCQVDDIESTLAWRMKEYPEYTKSRFVRPNALRTAMMGSRVSSAHAQPTASPV